MSLEPTTKWIRSKTNTVYTTKHKLITILKLLLLSRLRLASRVTSHSIKTRRFLKHLRRICIEPYAICIARLPDDLKLTTTTDDPQNQPEKTAKIIEMEIICIYIRKRHYCVYYTTEPKIDRSIYIYVYI